MPIAEQEAWEIATREATGADGAVDKTRLFAVYKAEYERRIGERRAKLTRDTQAVFRAMDGWARVESEDAWHAMVERAADDPIPTDEGSPGRQPGRLLRRRPAACIRRSTS